MKQISKTNEVLAKLRASYGADANVDNLAVYEAVLLNTLPLRKTGGIFQGARASLSLLTEMAGSINRESIPIRIEHMDADTPQGRVFYAEVVDDELRGLLAVDGSDPTMVAKVDNGTIDQVSVGMQNKRLNCSKCGFDFMAPDAYEARYTLTCDDGHTIGEDGTHVWIDGLKLFLETSLVGVGAAQGARIVGPKDAVLAKHSEFERLAASAQDTGIALIRLSPTHKEETPVDLTQLTTRLEESAGQRAVLQAQNETLTGQVTTLTARVAELEPAGAELDAARAELTAAQTAVTEAVNLLKAEAKAILTACGKTIEDDKLPGDAAGLVALITEHRAQLSALIPAGGAAASADTKAELSPSRSNSAFQAR